MSGPYRTSGVLPRLQKNQRVLVGLRVASVSLHDMLLPSDPAVRAAIYFIIGLMMGGVLGALWVQYPW